MLRFSEAFYVSSKHYDGYKCGAFPKLHTSIPPSLKEGQVLQKNTFFQNVITQIYVT
ncbi:MAG: hypothetical protein ACK4GN_10280 [Runella sp.]